MSSMHGARCRHSSVKVRVDTKLLQRAVWLPAKQYKAYRCEIQLVPEKLCRARDHRGEDSSELSSTTSLRLTAEGPLRKQVQPGQVRSSQLHLTIYVFGRILVSRQPQLQVISRTLGYVLIISRYIPCLAYGQSPYFSWTYQGIQQRWNQQHRHHELRRLRQIKTHPLLEDEVPR